MSDEKLVELTRIYDPIAADLFAAFLEDGGIEFQMRRSARSMASVMPSAETPTIFMVYEQDLETGKELFETYKKEQAASLPPNGDVEDDTNGD